MAESSSASSGKSISDLERETTITLEIIERLKNQKGLNFHIHREAIEDKNLIDNSHETEVEALQEFFQEVGQFKSDVDQITANRNQEPKDVSKKIAYEEDKLVKDMDQAAAAVLAIENLKEKALEEIDEYEMQEKQILALMMTDVYIMLEAILRDFLYYFSEAYFDVRVRAKKLSEREIYEKFHEEVEKIKEDEKIKEVLDLIKEDYGSPSNLENDRYAGLEEKIMEFRPE